MHTPPHHRSPVTAMPRRIDKRKNTAQARGPRLLRRGTHIQSSETTGAAVTPNPPTWVNGTRGAALALHLCRSQCQSKTLVVDRGGTDVASRCNVGDGTSWSRLHPLPTTPPPHLLASEAPGQRTRDRGEEGSEGPRRVHRASRVPRCAEFGRSLSQRSRRTRVDGKD